MKAVSAFFIKYMAIIILLVGIISLFEPQAGIWIPTAWINYMLMVVMFGMGLTLKPESFTALLKMPRKLAICVIAQYSIMPLLAFLLCHLLRLDAALSAGVILVGACPGGTASNVITYFAKGDVALSVCMTGINTLLAPILTPFITFILLNTTVEVELTGMVLGIVSVVLVPIICGFLIRKFFGNITEQYIDILPVISVIAICLIVSTVVAHNAEKIFTCGLTVLSVVILHNLLGYGFGYSVARALKMTPAQIKAVSIEIGMQNSGLASGLAGTSFPALTMATVPGAIFSVWHNISGAILAELFKRRIATKEQTIKQSCQHKDNMID